MWLKAFYAVATVVVSSHRRDPSASSSSTLNCFIDSQAEDKDADYISKLYCEQCLGIIWRLVQVWNRCMDLFDISATPKRHGSKCVLIERVRFSSQMRLLRFRLPHVLP